MNTDHTNSKTDDQWRQDLSEEQYQVMRHGATEPPFTGKYYKTKDRGMYVCAGCGSELFSSDAKFDSGSGWPSFTDPANRENIVLVPDNSHGMIRVEVKCKKCDAHLGHLFDDGPADKGGKRFCINSACLDLKT